MYSTSIPCRGLSTARRSLVRRVTFATATVPCQGLDDQRIGPLPRLAGRPDPVRLGVQHRVDVALLDEPEDVDGLLLRMLLMTGAGPERLGQGIARIKTEITTSALLSEWSGDRHVAVDIPPEAETDGLLKVMEREVAEAGAFWEWAHAEPFSTHH